MSERKVLNKYIPPNFDPDKIPRPPKSRDKLHRVRLMAPFSMRCGTCGEYLYKGKKFNARKEIVYGQTYLGIQIYRFYIRCPTCQAEIAFKTDPQNTDYILELGATRNFEPWKEERLLNEFMQKMREQEEEYDPMKALENRTLDSKRELEIMESLDEIRGINERIEKADIDLALEKVVAKVTPQEAQKLMQEELDRLADDEIIKKVFKKEEEEEEEETYVKRIEDDDEEDVPSTSKLVTWNNVKTKSQPVKKMLVKKKQAKSLVSYSDDE